MTGLDGHMMSYDSYEFIYQEKSRARKTTKQRFQIKNRLPSPKACGLCSECGTEAVEEPKAAD